MPYAFTDHVALLTAYLDRRAFIVEAIERQILNVQDKSRRAAATGAGWNFCSSSPSTERSRFPTAPVHTHRSPPPTWKTASSLSPGTLTRTGSIPWIS